MKKIITVGSALMLLSTSAFASKARLQSLGEDKDGSYYISDFRNIYINPAELNSMGNKVVLEWGSTGSTFGGSSLDGDAATKAQGGVVYGLANGMKFGAVLGDETDVAALTRMLASNGGTYAAAGEKEFMQTADNVIDLFLSGKSSVTWGANLLYSSSKDETTGTNKHKQNAYALRFGAIGEGWNAHSLLALGAKGDAPNRSKAPEYKGKFGIRVGGGYDLSTENKLFGMFERYSWEQSYVPTAARVTREASFQKAIFGIGHTLKVTEASTVFAKLHGEMVAIKLNSDSVNTEAKIDRIAIPLTVGLEHTAFDWMVLRGSIVQNIFGTVKDSGLQSNFGTASSTSPVTATQAGQILRYLASARYGSSLSGNGGKQTLAGSTTVNAGMTLKFGSVEIDGNIGATSASRTDTTPSSTVGTSTNKGVLAFDNLESRVGMTYNF